MHLHEGNGRRRRRGMRVVAALGLSLGEIGGRCGLGTTRMDAAAILDSLNLNSDKILTHLIHLQGEVKKEEEEEPKQEAAGQNSEFGCLLGKKGSICECLE